MKTIFEVGKLYNAVADATKLLLKTPCRIIERTNDSITLVEEYEENMKPVVVPIQKFIDRYGNRFEFAQYLGDNMYSYSQCQTL